MGSRWVVSCFAFSNAAVSLVSKVSCLRYALDSLFLNSLFLGRRVFIKRKEQREREVLITAAEDFS